MTIARNTNLVTDSQLQKIEAELLGGLRPEQEQEIR